MLLIVNIKKHQWVHNTHLHQNRKLLLRTQTHERALKVSSDIDLFSYFNSNSHTSVKLKNHSTFFNRGQLFMARNSFGKKQEMGKHVLF